MELKGRRAAVVGVGISNMALIRYLIRKGASVIASDRRGPAELGERARELEALGVPLITGEGYLDHLAEHDLIFLTPGIPKHLPPIEEARRRGALITGEIGLLLEVCRAPVVAVTGSAGKTTTTTLIGEILREGGARVHVGGNIGTPLIERVEEIEPDSTVVLELSSFQLQLVRRSPHIAVITNISPNHLDVHASMEEYVDAKKQIFRYQSARDWLILNHGDARLRGFAAEARSRIVFFSRHGDPGGKSCAFVRDGQVVWRHEGREYPVMAADAIKLMGLHNLENALAATAAAFLAGAPASAVRRVLTTFPGVEHRIEPVRELDGARWYNDSKATSPTEAVACLSTLPAPIVLIAGGSDKGIPFDPMAPLVREKVKALILTGPTAPKIEEAVRRGGYEGPIRHAANMEEAVRLAREAARPGDSVVLSPACASFDAYRNFEERGRHFKQLVMALK